MTLHQMALDFAATTTNHHFVVFHDFGTQPAYIRTYDSAHEAMQDIDGMIDAQGYGGTAYTRSYGIWYTVEYQPTLGIQLR